MGPKCEMKINATFNTLKYFFDMKVHWQKCISEIFIAKFVFYSPYSAVFYFASLLKVTQPKRSSLASRRLMQRSKKLEG